MNLASAEILIDNHYFAPSVHCSYYGCFQYIKSKLNRIGFTYSRMDQDIANSKQLPRAQQLHSNKYPLDLIVKEVEKKSNRIYRKEVNDKIKKLKLFRTESDYHNVIVDDRKSRLALGLSKEIIKLIEKKI